MRTKAVFVAWALSVSLAGVSPGYSAQHHADEGEQRPAEGAGDPRQDGEESPAPGGMIEPLKYIKQPGFAYAASKIFSADRRWTLSGFGEFNYTNFRGPKNIDTPNLEMVNTNLYRSGTYFGYRLTNRLIFLSELQAEFLHDGTREGHGEVNFEAVFDVLFNRHFNVRIGNYPLPLGYVNVNEEPIAFYTVNRPEVERIMVPSQWLDMGVMFYGDVAPKLEYSFGITKGLDGLAFDEDTWIRNGRFVGMPLPQAVNGKLEYSGVPQLTVGLAGYRGNAGNRRQDPSGESLDPMLSISTLFTEYEWGNLTFFGLLARGWLSETDRIHATNGKVIGSRTSGGYGEVRWDVMPYLKPASEWKFPVFLRYERLNTHAGVHRGLTALPREENDLRIVSVGFNARPKRNITFKANYQFRKNFFPMARVPESNRVEVGLGFIY